MPSAEHEHGHHHGTGVKWLDIIVGLSAMFISVVSLVVSIEHGRTMEKMVEQNEKMVTASTLPYLISYGGQLDEVSRKPALHLTIKNGGVGPAIVEWFEVSYKGKVYGDLTVLLHACCSEAIPKDGNTSGVVYSNVSGTVLPARETTNFIEFEPGMLLPLQESLDKARKEMKFSSCFCSVLHECWMTEFSESKAKQVEACPAKAKEEVW